MLSVFILEAFFNDKSHGILALHSLNDAETSTTEVEHLFLGIELVGFLQFFEDAVEMSFFSSFLMLDGCHGNIQGTVTDRADVPRPPLLRSVMMIPLGFFVVILAQEPSLYSLVLF